MRYAAILLGFLILAVAAGWALVIALGLIWWGRRGLKRG